MMLIRTRTLATVVLAVLLSACGGGETLADTSISDSRVDSTISQDTRVVDGQLPDTTVDAPSFDAMRRDTNFDSAINLDASDAAQTGTTLSFVWSAFDVPAPSSDNRTPGFNIDGFVSPVAGGTTCEHLRTDYQALMGTAGGIDNAFSGRVPSINTLLTGPLLMRGSLHDSITTGLRSGRALILMVVRGINDPMSDNDVIVSFHQGTRTGTINWDATNQELASGQTFIGGPALAAVAATIENGVLHALIGALRVPVYTSGGANPVTYYINLREAEMSANLVLRAPSSGLRSTVTNGNIGGSVPVTELLDLFVQVADSPLATRALIDSQFMLTQNADLNPDSTGSCQSMSVGVAFRGAEALVPTFQM